MTTYYTHTYTSQVYPQVYGNVYLKFEDDQWFVYNRNDWCWREFDELPSNANLSEITKEEAFLGIL